MQTNYFRLKFEYNCNADNFNFFKNNLIKNNSNILNDFEWEYKYIDWFHDLKYNFNYKNIEPINNNNILYEKNINSINFNDISKRFLKYNIKYDKLDFEWFYNTYRNINDINEFIINYNKKYNTHLKKINFKYEILNFYVRYNRNYLSHFQKSVNDYEYSSQPCIIFLNNIYLANNIFILEFSDSYFFAYSYINNDNSIFKLIEQRFLYPGKFVLIKDYLISKKDYNYEIEFKINNLNMEELSLFYIGKLNKFHNLKDEIHNLIPMEGNLFYLEFYIVSKGLIYNLDNHFAIKIFFINTNDLTKNNNFIHSLLIISKHIKFLQVLKSNQVYKFRNISIINKLNMLYDNVDYEMYEMMVKINNFNNYTLVDKKFDYNQMLISNYGDFPCFFNNIIGYVLIKEKTYSVIFIDNDTYIFIYGYLFFVVKELIKIKYPILNNIIYKGDYKFLVINNNNRQCCIKNARNDKLDNENLGLKYFCHESEKDKFLTIFN